MNWTRGLVRLWVLSSIVWLLVWVGLNVLESFNARNRSARPLTETDIVKCMAENPGPWCRYLRRGIGTRVVVDDLRWPSPSQLSLGLIPPIIVYAFGASLFWALSGFRRRPDAG